VVALISVAERVPAVIGTDDVVPAATLLLPYFEVDPAANRTSTLLSINNADALAVTAHVTLWTDLGVPTLGFDVFLTGYDVQTLNLRDVLIAGTLPKTSGCLPTRPLSAARLVHLQAAHSGKPAGGFGGLCAAHDHGDAILRGYVTVDAVNTCSSANVGVCNGEAPCATACGDYCTGLGGVRDTSRCAGFCEFGSNDGGDCTSDQDCPGGSCIAGEPPSCQCRCQVFPSGAGYFANGGVGVASDSNVLWGDSFQIDPGGDTAHGEPLVHIEASSADQRVTTAGNYTFYGHLVNGSAADNREALATTWGATYVNTLTDLTCWRDTGALQSPFACGTVPPLLPLTEVVFFDYAENPMDGNGPACGLATARVTVGGPTLPVPFKSGWVYLNLNHARSPLFDGREQSYLGVIRAVVPGSSTISVNAVALDNATEPQSGLRATREPPAVGATVADPGAR
jgi:hypothetical protein